MAGGQQEEEEECEDCKLQTILRVNPNIEPSSVGDILTEPWQRFSLIYLSEPAPEHAESF